MTLKTNFSSFSFSSRETIYVQEDGKFKPLQTSISNLPFLLSFTEQTMNKSTLYDHKMLNVTNTKITECMKNGPLADKRDFMTKSENLKVMHILKLISM